MRRYLISVLAIFALLMPMQSQAQSGDSSPLDSLEGLEQAIGRSWVTPIGGPSMESEATPESAGDVDVFDMNAIVYEFDSADNAAAGLERFHDDQLLLIENDPNTPASEPLETADLGDDSFGFEGTFPMPGADGKREDMAVVSLNVQQDNLVIQLFGTMAPGDHIETTTGIAEDILAAEAGDGEPAFDENGGSTGGLWEKLNAIDIVTANDTVVYDLQIYPMGGDVVQGDSITVPTVDLENIGTLPGLTGGWYQAYGTAQAGTPAASPVANQTGPFSIELWILEFEDAGHASAAAFSLQQGLTDPLRIVDQAGEGFSSEGSQDLNLESTGFTGDDLPEGDAGVVVRASGNTVYAARVYTREPAPTPIARSLVDYMAETPAGTDEATVDGAIGAGGVWERFPKVGDELLYGLDPVVARFSEPTDAPFGMPVG